MESSNRAPGRLAGYLFALGAGSLWGTTGPLSTALYARGAELTGVGFWRIAIATAGFLVYGLVRPGLFRVDRKALLLVGLAGGAFVALFEVSYQYAIAGVGVAGAAALLYTAPVMVAVLAAPFLGERLTVARLGLAIGVMIGAGLTVGGGTGALDVSLGGVSAAGVGVIGGLLAAAAYAATTLIARFAVPRYGSVKVLFLEIGGGTLILSVALPLAGRAPTAPATAADWIFALLLALGAILAANFLFFGGVRRIEAAPTAVAATIEPVVAALLALMLFGQRLTAAGWVGLLLVVGSVASSYAWEAAAGRRRASAEPELARTSSRGPAS
ncbi:MAG: DMT family transporter [Gemmatimonadota bacterium]